MHWSIAVLDLLGFLIVSVVVGILLVFKTELGIKPYFDRQKAYIARIVLGKRGLNWLAGDHALTLLALAIGVFLLLPGRISALINSLSS